MIKLWMVSILYLDVHPLRRAIIRRDPAKASVNFYRQKEAPPWHLLFQDQPDGKACKSDLSALFEKHISAFEIYWRYGSFENYFLFCLLLRCILLAKPHDELLVAPRAAHHAD